MYKLEYKYYITSLLKKLWDYKSYTISNIFLGRGARANEL